MTFTHVALHVRDLEASVAFYRDFCGLGIVQERVEHGERIVWMAESGRERELIFVLIPGGPGREIREGEFGHLGFAVASKAEVDEIAERARALGCLAWPPRQDPYPVGYFCGLQDPDGTFVEFSYGQPLGPGAEGEDRVLRAREP
jgi:catechol 2,3-dioxygenase-like lactoylglutathione lyase family enzyme